MLNLRKKDEALIRKILGEIIPHKTVWAYGSRVKGTHHAGSDLDLIIVSTSDGEKEILEYLSRLRGSFSESNIAILIDINDWSQIPEAFKEEIQKSHIVFQEGDLSCHLQKK